MCSQKFSECEDKLREQWIKENEGKETQYDSKTVEAMQKKIDDSIVSVALCFNCYSY